MFYNHFYVYYFNTCLLLFYVCDCFVCVYVCALYACLVLSEVRESTGPL